MLVWPNHPVPGTESPHSSISCPSQRGGQQLPATFQGPWPSALCRPSCLCIRPAPGTSRPPSRSALPCQAPAGCCSCRYPAPIGMWSQKPLEGGKASREIPPSQEKRNAWAATAGPALAPGENRDRVLSCPRAQQPGPLVLGARGAHMSWTTNTAPAPGTPSEGLGHPEPCGGHTNRATVCDGARQPNPRQS